MSGKPMINTGDRLRQLPFNRALLFLFDSLFKDGRESIPHCLLMSFFILNLLFYHFAIELVYRHKGTLRNELVNGLGFEHF